MIGDVLKNLSLDPKQIEAYLTLLKLGPNRASVVAYQIGQPRTTVQNILLRLEKEGLVTRSQQGNVSIFTPTHPDDLIKLVEDRQRAQNKKYESIIKDLKLAVPDLIDTVNISKSIPNVKFYRGKEAARTVLFDTLTSKTELKDYANIDAMFKHVKDINDEYVKEREKTKITKRSLLLDTPFAHKVYDQGKYSPKSHKGYKWINSELYPFTLEMNIYDGKVSYLTYVEDNFVGVIIKNDYIYQMHESTWNLLWDLLPDPKKI